jgi:DNA modification methylase
MRVDIIDINLIDVSDRAREDLGDLQELIRSIRDPKKGLIQPLAVEDTKNGRYKLLAGGRRFEACKAIDMVRVPVRIYDEPLSEAEQLSIELEENLNRKDLTFQEEVNLKRRIHNQQVAIHGPKVQGARTDLGQTLVGHSLHDTAVLFKEDVQSVRRDIKLAEAMDQFPDLGWDKCKNKAEAMKLMNRTEEEIIRAELAKRATGTLSKDKQRLAEKYIVGDFFEKVKGIPDGVIDLVEVDPPFGISLPSIKDNRLENIKSWYNEIPANEYASFVDRLIAECWRVMNDRSWLIFWFGPEPWFETVFSILVRHGFEGRRLTGKWVKTNSPHQVHNPRIHLANASEEFFYMRKGDASISLKKQGRSNIFEFPVVPSQRKIHPTEKPILLMKEILETFAYPGARVLVPFAGSGNTLVAAISLQMDPIGYDLAREGKDGFVVRLLGEL